MFNIWRENILENVNLVGRSAGPSIVTVVSGSESDEKYWQKAFALKRRDVFRKDGDTLVVAVSESIRKGNFLGTFNAWINTKRAISVEGEELPDVALMSMVFGKGKRLSPFTQALGNRKSAFPTPMKAENAQAYLNTADFSNIYSNLWGRHLCESGFRGVIVKWGDEAILPGEIWASGQHDYSNIDAVRFVWKTGITEDLAREKDWVVIDAQTGLMISQHARQGVNSLKQRLSELRAGTYQVGVNLGSLAISYEFLDVALKVLHDDILDPHKWADWDPYVWIALCCKDESQWKAEIEHERRIGKTGIHELEYRYPDFYARITHLRNAMESEMGRSLAIGVLDFGKAFWTDMGLHITLRKCLESLTTDSERGRATRELFGISQKKDRNGNTILRSVVPDSASIRNSIIIDSVILDEAAVINGGVVIGGRHRRLQMPRGGSALFCAVNHLTFVGPHGIAFRSVGDDITVPEGGRHTTLFLPNRTEDMISNESILDYSGKNYSQPILGNRLSFEEAGEIMSAIDDQSWEARWAIAWKNWLDS